MLVKGAIIGNSRGYVRLFHSEGGAGQVVPLAQSSHNVFTGIAFGVCVVTFYNTANLSGLTVRSVRSDISHCDKKGKAGFDSPFQNVHAGAPK